MKKVAVIGSLIVLGFWLLFIFGLVLKWQMNKNKVLETTIQQYEHQIQEKDRELQGLRQQMDYLVSQQRILEKNLRVRKENIKRISLVVSNMTEKEICDEFKRLGYNPVCR